MTSSKALAAMLALSMALTTPAFGKPVILPPAEIFAIQNVLAHYSHRWDSGDYDGFSDLFSEATQVDMGGFQIRGKKELREFHTKRTEEFRAIGVQRRHLFGSIAIEPISDDRARVDLYGVVFNTAKQTGKIEFMPPVRYQGILARAKDGRWLIETWQAKPDQAFPPPI